MARRALTPKQQAFVDEYLIDLNATAAYRRAGYRPATDHAAEVGASRLLRNVEVQAAVAAASEARAGRLAITQDVVVRGLLAETGLRGEGSSQTARVKAWELLGRHVGMFPAKVEHAGTVRLEVAEEVVDAPPANGPPVGAAASGAAGLPPQ